MLIEISSGLTEAQIEALKAYLDKELCCDHSVYFDSIENKVIFNND